MDLAKIGKYIAEKRKALGLTQKELAEKLGMSDKSVPAIVSGKSTLLEALAIAHGFNPEGGTKNYVFSTHDTHSELCDAIRISRGYRKERWGYFLRAESFYNVATQEEEYADICKAEELADFTIVCPHWGTEYRLTPDASQEKWVRIFLENGADLVFGTHPHVIEPIEWVTNPENGHEMLVYYSLGNFVNWTSGTGEGVANRMVGGIPAKIIKEIPQSGDAENISVDEYGLWRIKACSINVKNIQKGGILNAYILQKN